MSKADELLRRWQRYGENAPPSLVLDTQDYLNEKPHEPLADLSGVGAGEYTGCLAQVGKPVAALASPPHAAAGRIRVGEFNCECPECGMHWSRFDSTESHDADCPNAPHAAAEPEKPMTDHARLNQLVRSLGLDGAEQEEEPAEPVGQPIAWMYESEHSCAGPFIERRVRFSLDRDAAVQAKYTETPLYASPSAQPIARVEQDAKRYRWLRERIDDNGRGKARLTADIHIDFYNRGMSLDEAIDYHLKSAGKEST